MATEARPKLRLLELFAGSRSVGKVAELLGMEVLSVDLVDYPGVQLVGDVLTIPMKRFTQFRPDVIWASPPCTAFSVASMGKHWGGGRKAYLPKSANAYLGQALVRRAQEVIHAHPNALWFMENPVGVLRNLPLMQGFGTRHTVTYCSYGDIRQKRTDIWTNCAAWRPKAECRKNQVCHVAAPRGSRTGTQGLAGAHERAIIPPALCMDVLTAALKQMRMAEKRTNTEV